jgi:dTDP-4-dehydrorhamnose 3,5-epimerase-like enzyme
MPNCAKNFRVVTLQEESALIAKHARLDQIQQAQGKLERTVEGEILDVAVDVRRSSPTLADGKRCACRARTSACCGSQ